MYPLLIHPDLFMVVFKFSCVAITITYCPVNGPANTKVKGDPWFTLRIKGKKKNT